MNSKTNPFISDSEVRWCPGCGDYAILKTLQRLLPTLSFTPENTVFISGIGCSGRLPYYLDTYGLHGIHGRAPAIATGLKIARPELASWVITGDGDGLSIGLSHLLHCMRRNINTTILLFNNQIYGLTKGQYSPTSPQGVLNKTVPFGALDQPFNPVVLALAAGCGFVARGIDVDPTLGTLLKQAHEFPGTAFVEILQNCNVYNDKAFSAFTDKALRQARCLFLETNKPLRFGHNNEKGLLWQDGQLAVCQANADAENILIHNPTKNQNLPLDLAQMAYPEFPVAFGVFRAIKRPIYEVLLQKRTQKTSSLGAFKQILEKGHTWKID